MTPRRQKRRVSTKTGDGRGSALAAGRRNHDQVVRAICSYCELVLHAPATITDAARYGKAGFYSGNRVKPGWPDITACLPPHGTMLCVEVKTSKTGKANNPRDNQAVVIQGLREAGAVVIVTSDLTDFTQRIKEWDNGR